MATTTPLPLAWYHGAVGLLGDDAHHDAVLNHELLALGLGENGEARLAVEPLGHDGAEVRAAAAGPPVEALEEARSLVGVDALELHAVVHEPVDGVARLRHEVAPQVGVHAVVGVGQLLPDDVEDGGEVDAGVLLHLASPAKHAFGAKGHAADLRGLLEGDDGCALVERLEDGAAPGGAGAYDHDVGLKGLGRDECGLRGLLCGFLGLGLNRDTGVLCGGGAEGGEAGG